MDVQGKLLFAQLQDSASDLTPVSTGLIYWNTATGFPKIYNGSAWKTLVDSDSSQTITNKITPTVVGSSSASGVLELSSTTHGTKGYIKVGDGSSILLDLDSATTSFASLMSSINGPTFAIANTGTASGNITMAADNAQTCFVPCLNSRGTFLSPSSFLSGDQLAQIYVRSWASATAQNFVAGQKTVGVLAAFATENHSTTSLGTGWGFTGVLNGTTSRRDRLTLDGTGQVIIGDPLVATGWNLKWALDGCGDIGASADFRPNNIYVKTAVHVPSLSAPAVVGGSSANGSLGLTGTSNVAKGHVKATDGSDLLVGNSVDAYANYINTTSGGIYSPAGSAPFASAFVGAIGDNEAAFGALLFYNSASRGGQIFLAHARGTAAVPAILQTNDVIGHIDFKTFATSAVNNVGTADPASIYAYMDDSAPSGTSLRSKISFNTAASGAIVPIERVTIGGANLGLSLRADSPLRLFNAANTFYTELKGAPGIAASYSLTFPVDDGTAGQVLSTDGAGVLSWVAAGGGSGDVNGFAGNWVTADGLTKSINHALGSTDIDVSIIDLSDNQVIYIDSIIVTDANNIALSASEAPASTWRVVVQAN